MKSVQSSTKKYVNFAIGRDLRFEDDELEAEYLSYIIISKKGFLQGLLGWAIIYPILWLVFLL